MASSTPSHPVIFSTSTQHVLPPSKYLIPGTWARFQLSQLVNKTLELAQPVPFDFLIRGQVLRGTIAEWCALNNVKEEETLEIEYFESLMPPKLLASIEGEDWVGSVSCQRKGYALLVSTSHLNLMLLQLYSIWFLRLLNSNIRSFSKTSALYTGAYWTRHIGLLVGVTVYYYFWLS
jgi:hypothetical protein